MEPRRVRLGDVIDDYCPRCRLIMNHGVVGMVGDEVRKVRCNTCITEHLYRHGRLPKRRRNETGRLFEEVLKGLGRQPGDPAEVPPELKDGEPGEEDPGATLADATAPDPEPGEPGRHEPVHGVRHKLYTIRRVTGGKPPGGGSHKP